MSEFSAAKNKFSVSEFRRGTSGILGEGDWDLQLEAARRDSEAALKHRGPSFAATVDDDAAASRRRKLFQHFPAVPYYGVLRGLVVEVPAGSASLTRVGRLLEDWSRYGGGQTWTFGATWAHQATPATVRLSAHDDVAAGGNGSTGPTAVPPPPPASSSTTATRRQRGAGATPHSQTWYGEFIEAFTDATAQFFRVAADASMPSLQASPRPHLIPVPPMLYMELHHHVVWRDVTLCLFVEDGLPNCFVATHHRPTQRYIAQRCAEVDVELEWVDGAVLVTSGWGVTLAGSSRDGGGGGKRTRGSSVHACRVLLDVIMNLDILTTAPKAASGGGGGASTTVSTTPSDVSLVASYPFLHGSWQSHRFRSQGLVVLLPPPTATASKQAANNNNKQSISSGTNNVHRYRGIQSDAGGDGEKEEDAMDATGGAIVSQCFVSIACQDGSVGMSSSAPHHAQKQHPQRLHQQQQRADNDGSISGSTALVSCFTTTPSILGPSLQSLIALLVDGAQLDRFKLRFDSWRTAMPSTQFVRSGGGGTTRGAGGAGGGGGGEALGGLATVQGRQAGATTATRAGSSSASTVTMLHSAINGSETSLSDGLGYSRLSSGRWLTRDEQIAVRASLESRRRDEDEVDPLDGDNAPIAGDDDDNDEDVEAEFFPIMLEYQRAELLPPTSSVLEATPTAATHAYRQGPTTMAQGRSLRDRWGASFYVTSCITAILGSAS